MTVWLDAVGRAMHGGGRPDPRRWSGWRSTRRTKPLLRNSFAQVEVRRRAFLQQCLTARRWQRLPGARFEMLRPWPKGVPKIAASVQAAALLRKDRKMPSIAAPKTYI